MFENIVGNIIYSEFEHKFGRSRPEAKTNSEIDKAMQVKFSLYPDYSKEYGYRYLTILLFGGGLNYIGVYGKLDWNVVSKDDIEDDDNLKEGKHYQEGKTPWVLLGYHDSCWRSCVDDTIHKYRDRICTIDTLFNGENGWYKSVTITDEQAESFREIRLNTPGYGNVTGKRIRLEELEFKF
jgi:hypothetical protein